jgi:hypothetical protein
VSAETEARKALGRLRRSVEKSLRELGAVEGALSHVEGSDFPAESYDRAEQSLRELLGMLDAEGQRLQDKILHAGGLEPGRVRRTGG